MTLQRACNLHDIFCKIKLDLPITQKERAYYLLYASNEQVKEFLREERRTKNDKTNSR